MSKSSCSSFIRLFSAVLLAKAMQHNVFNLLGICTILFFSLHFTLSKMKTNYLPHFNITVNHSGSILQQRVWTHASKHYREVVSSSSTADVCFCIYEDCYIMHTIKRYLVDSEGAVCRKGSTLWLRRLINIYF